MAEHSDIWNIKDAGPSNGTTLPEYTIYYGTVTSRTMRFAGIASDTAFSLRNTQFLVQKKVRVTGERPLVCDR